MLGEAQSAVSAAPLAPPEAARVRAMWEYRPEAFGEVLAGFVLGAARGLVEG